MEGRIEPELMTMQLQAGWMPYYFFIPYFEYDADVFPKRVCIDEGEFEGNGVGIEE